MLGGAPLAEARGTDMGPPPFEADFSRDAATDKPLLSASSG